MKLGLGLYDGMVTADNLRFARQISATHIVAHLPQNSFSSSKDGYWSYEDLRGLQQLVASHDLTLEAIENFVPGHWDQILLDGPDKAKQMENLKKTIRNMGKAGIPIMGYYFSLAGVWGRVWGPFARGGAESVGYIEAEAPAQTPIPNGEIWGQQVAEHPMPGNIGVVSREEMWERLTYFLQNLVPVAEEAGVRLAAHPDDPPLEVLRDTGRLITHPDYYQRLLDIVPSKHNGLEFCQGTITEMPARPMYLPWFVGMPLLVEFAMFTFGMCAAKRPNYREMFLDEGDVDMIEALRAYRDSGYEGVLIPDHTPRTSCDAPWHAGMAFALGYMRAAMNMLEKGK